jgi:hypothetical protein
MASSNTNRNSHTSSVTNIAHTHTHSSSNRRSAFRLHTTTESRLPAAQTRRAPDTSRQDRVPLACSSRLSLSFGALVHLILKVFSCALRTPAPPASKPSFLSTVLHKRDSQTRLLQSCRSRRTRRRAPAPRPSTLGSNDWQRIAHIRVRALSPSDTDCTVAFPLYSHSPDTCAWTVWRGPACSQASRPIRRLRQTRQASFCFPQRCKSLL